MQEKRSAAHVHQVEPRPADQYKTCVPLLDLHVVARAFVEGEEVEPEIWCEVPPGRALRPGMFVMQMIGHAMEPQIPDGACCLFERQRDERAHALQGRIVLAQHQDIYDPETGGNYTIRRYTQEQGSGASRNRSTWSIRLLPLHPAYAPILLDNVPIGERHVIATFLTVLDPHA
jgi:SOS-response transcriptional repressor LexA